MRGFALLFSLVCIGAADTALAQTSTDEGCLLRLKIVDKNVKPIAEAPVELLDDEGRVVLTIRAKQGEAEICDQDFGRYSVRVWSGGCLPTTISGIWFKPTEPLRVTILVNDCNEYHLTRTDCSAYIRAVTLKGLPVQHAEAWQDKLRWKVAGDEFGRLVFPVSRGATTKVKVGAPGFESQMVSLSCADVENIERRVILEPRQ